MAWNKHYVFRDTYTIELYDRLLGERVTIQRRVEEYGGYLSFGRFSYRGEPMKLFGATAGYGEGEDYPPPLRRCKTERAKKFWQENPP